MFSKNFWMLKSKCASLEHLARVGERGDSKNDFKTCVPQVSEAIRTVS